MWSFSNDWVTHEWAKATKQDLRLVQSVCFSFLSLFAFDPGDGFLRRQHCRHRNWGDLADDSHAVSSITIHLHDSYDSCFRLRRRGGNVTYFSTPVKTWKKRIVEGKYLQCQGESDGCLLKIEILITTGLHNRKVCRLQIPPNQILLSHIKIILHRFTSHIQVLQSHLEMISLDKARLTAGSRQLGHPDTCTCVHTLHTIHPPLSLKKRSLTYEWQLNHARKWEMFSGSPVRSDRTSSNPTLWLHPTTFCPPHSQPLIHPDPSQGRAHGSY